MNTHKRLIWKKKPLQIFNAIERRLSFSLLRVLNNGLARTIMHFCVQRCIHAFNNSFALKKVLSQVGVHELLGFAHGSKSHHVMGERTFGLCTRLKIPSLNGGTNFWRLSATRVTKFLLHLIDGKNTIYHVINFWPILRADSNHVEYNK